jgi:hypothetical protein
MANREDDLEQWVEERLTSLEPAAGWQPDGDRLFAAIGRFERTMRRRRVQRLLVVAAFAVLCAAALLVEAPKAYCAGSACGAPKSAPAAQQQAPTVP